MKINRSLYLILSASYNSRKHFINLGSEADRCSSMNSIMNTAIGAMAVGTFLVVCLMKKKKLKLSTVFDSLRGPYFNPTKQLTVKDEVFLSMLENCQSVGPCYVITDPSLRGR